MNWSWLLSLLWKLLGLFRGKGTRITFEARPEAAIERERKELTKLADKVRDLQDEIDALSVRIAFEKADGRNTSALDTQRERLLHHRHAARLKYDYALRRQAPGR